MKIVICIGSSCHVKGSRQVVSKLEKLIENHSLNGKVELEGTFCLGRCQQGVCVKIGDEFFSVSPDTVEEFFNNNILPVL